MGDWCAQTEVDGKKHGHWIELAADGTWRRVEDYFGFRAENRGRWRAEGEGAALQNLDVRLHLEGRKLLLDARGQTLYAFERCPGLPADLRDLPSFPRTLSETVAILSAELAEPERAVIAGTLEQDLPRFHHGLGTYIRNHFGLWGPNPALLAACKVQHPDDASDVILRALRQHLRNTRPGGRELDQLERVLVELTVAPVPIRRMTVAQLVTAVNRELERALARKGLLRDAVVLELAPPKDERDRLRRERDYLSHPPRLRAWGRGATGGVSPLALLPAFKKWLKVPGRMILEPDFDSGRFLAPDRSPDFASARWRDDWFEIETSVERGTSPSESMRVDAWSMLGHAPPMPVEQAGVRAGEAREHLPAGKQLVEIAIVGSPAGDAWEWAYAVRSRLESRKDDGRSPSPEATSALGGTRIRPGDRVSKSRWPDPRKPPGISAQQALGLFRESRKDIGPPAPSGVEIRLRRAGSSTYWFYQIVLHEQDATAEGIVTLDGRVRVASEPGTTAPTGPSRQ